MEISIEKWKRRYYPVPAKSVTTWIGAAAHSFRKWMGLAVEPLPRDIRSEVLGGSGCALCVMSSRSSRDGFIDCEVCPMMKFQSVSCGAKGSAYVNYIQSPTPQNAQAVAVILSKTLNHLVKLEANGTPWNPPNGK